MAISCCSLSTFQEAKCSLWSTLTMPPIVVWVSLLISHIIPAWSCLSCNCFYQMPQPALLSFDTTTKLHCSTLPRGNDLAPRIYIDFLLFFFFTKDIYRFDITYMGKRAKLKLSVERFYSHSQFETSHLIYSKLGPAPGKE